MRSNICSGTSLSRWIPAIAGILLLLFSAFNSTLAAENEKSQAGSKKESVVKNPVKKDAKSAASQEKVKGEELEISVKAPQAYYIMPRSNLNIEGLELNESFIPKIIKSVEEEPF